MLILRSPGFLTVVAPVDAVGKLREGDLEKGMRLDAVAVHVCEEAAFSRETSHVVVYYLYLKPFPGFPDQEVCHPVTELVIEKDIVLYVD